MGGAKRIVRFWGGAREGGGKRTQIMRALQKKFWRPQKVGFPWSVPVSSKENNRAKTNGGGGETYHRWGGGSKTVFGKGFYGMFSPPLSFPPPFVFLRLCRELRDKNCPKTRRPRLEIRSAGSQSLVWQRDGEAVIQRSGLPNR